MILSGSAQAGGSHMAPETSHTNSGLEILTPATIDSLESADDLEPVSTLDNAVILDTQRRCWALMDSLQNAITLWVHKSVTALKDAIIADISLATVEWFGTESELGYLSDFVCPHLFRLELSNLKIDLTGLHSLGITSADAWAIKITGIPNSKGKRWDMLIALPSVSMSEYCTDNYQLSLTKYEDSTMQDVITIREIRETQDKQTQLEKSANHGSLTLNTPQGFAVSQELEQKLKSILPDLAGVRA